jgi:hypothetical protein
MFRPSALEQPLGGSDAASSAWQADIPRMPFDDDARQQQHLYADMHRFVNDGLLGDLSIDRGEPALVDQEGFLKQVAKNVEQRPESVSTSASREANQQFVNGIALGAAALYLIARGKPLYGSALFALSLSSLASSLPGAPENELELAMRDERQTSEMSKIDAIMHPQWLPLEYFQSLNAGRMTGIRPITAEQ